jgi:hypothetical protein
MKKDEWDSLSEESKWNLYSKNESTSYVNGWIPLFRTKKVEDTREDNSDECWYDLDTHIWAYINPFNKKQRMWVDEIGFNVETIDDTWTSNKEDGIKSVWQKVERIDELTDGDFVRVWNDELDKKHISNKGIITNIIFKNRFEYHYYNNTPDYYNNKSRILSIEIDFNDNWKNVEKAVLEGCQE